jgi:16S rRNA (cytosine967-C5)-methyltransferase
VTPAARIAAAIELLAEIEGASKRPADAVANDFFRARRFIGAGDRRAVSERAWGVLRARRRLGWWLSDGVDYGTPPDHTPQRTTLHGPTPQSPTPRTLVAASLMFEGWAPPGVAEAFSGGKFAAAPLSAVEQASLAPLAGHTLDHPAMPDAVRLEVPDWVLPRLAARFGRALGAELGALLDPATLDLRANLLKASREEVRTALAAEGFEATPTPFSPWGLRLPGRRPVTAGPAFQSGLVEIQDEGSQLVALLTDARPGMRVADLCAGAGGKTLALAVTMGNRGHIAACDVSAPRLDAAVRRFRRAGAHNIERHLLGPGDRWLKRHAGGFDRVLVDAPCTGIGTWRRNPDARARLTETDLAELVIRQAELLDDAAALVRKGGRLVYATCSLFPEENEAQVQSFLGRHAAFALVPLARAWPKGAPHGASPSAGSPSAGSSSVGPPEVGPPEVGSASVGASSAGPPCTGETLTLTPRQHGTDGFFAAVLERSA